MNKYCEFWNTGDQCLFCNINATLKDQGGGEDVVARIDPETIAEVVKTAITVDHHYNQLIVSGGTILGKYRGQTEARFLPHAPQRDKEEAAGVDSYVRPDRAIRRRRHEEASRDRLFFSGAEYRGLGEEAVPVGTRPGKEKYVGYDEWIRRTIRAVDFWGPGLVNPNFVVGVEMAKPYGFDDVSRPPCGQPQGAGIS